jgi:hypothetical protein
VIHIMIHKFVLMSKSVLCCSGSADTVATGDTVAFSSRARRTNRRRAKPDASQQEE